MALDAEYLAVECLDALLVFVLLACDGCGEGFLGLGDEEVFVAKACSEEWRVLFLKYL